MSEKFLSFFFLLFSITYLFFAHDLTFGTLSAPKSGFFPMLTAISAMLLSIAAVIKGLVKNKNKNFISTNWTKFIFLTTGLLFYILILDVVGYLAATFIIMLYLLKITDTIGWIIPLSISASMSLVFYLIFEQLLSITLP